jgi:hypothetical protein
LKFVEAAQNNEGESLPTFTPRADLASTVRDYLTDKLALDSDKDAILALADEFLRVEGDI